MNSKTTSLVLVTVLAIVSLASITNAKAKDEKKTDQDKVKAPSASTVVATMNKEKLTLGDLPKLKKFIGRQVDNDSLIILWKLNVLLADKARKEKLDRDPQNKVLFKLANDEALARMYIIRKQETAVITPEETKDFYEKNKDKPGFREPSQVSIKLIAVPTKEEADKIKAELTAGQDFDALREKNKDQTLKTTGLSSTDLQNVSIDTLKKPLGDLTAFNVERQNLNEIIGPRQLPDTRGWLLLKVTARTQGKPLALEKATEKINAILQRRKNAVLENEIINEARKEIGIPVQPQPMIPPSMK